MQCGDNIIQYINTWWALNIDRHTGNLLSPAWQKTERKITQLVQKRLKERFSLQSAKSAKKSDMDGDGNWREFFEKLIYKLRVKEERSQKAGNSIIVGPIKLVYPIKLGQSREK